MDNLTWDKVKEAIISNSPRGLDLEYYYRFMKGIKDDLFPEKEHQVAEIYKEEVIYMRMKNGDKYRFSEGAWMKCGGWCLEKIWNPLDSKEVYKVIAWYNENKSMLFFRK